MSRDVDAVLRGWDFKPDTVQARLLRAQDGREVVQMRVELGVLQMEIAGRPDGRRPHGFPNCLAYLKHIASEAAREGRKFTLSQDHCREADREFTQFYHRRVCWMALRRYEKAVADADHTLAFMDFVRDHSPDEEFTRAHEQYRGFVLFHRTQAAAAGAAEAGEPEAAVDAVLAGLAAMRAFFAANGLDEYFDEDGMVQQLRQVESSLRSRHGIEETLREKLDRAVAEEDYEGAARLRDALRQREEGRTGGTSEA